MHPNCSFMLVHVCADIHTLHLCVSLKWFYLSQHSSPMTGGMEENGMVVQRGTRSSCAEATQPATPVSVKVQEQVEVWILNIEKLHQGSIFIPIATALKAEVGDGLSASSIPQT